MDPTLQQQANRFNPTPVTNSLPVGFFRDYGSYPTALYYNPGGGQPIQVFEDRKPNGQWVMGVDLANQYGLDYRNLPQVDTGLLRREMESGKLPWWTSGNSSQIPQLKAASATGPTQNFTYNNQPNSLASPEMYQANALATQNQLLDNQPAQDPRTQAINYLRSQGYTNPDEGEIQGAMQELGLNTAQTAQNTTGNTTGTSGNAVGAGSTTGTTTSSGLTIRGIDISSFTPEAQALIKILDDNLTRLEKNGQVLNPNVQITPAQAAEFLAKAQNEINPYFQGQVKMAKDSLLASLGYTKEELANTEADLERKYGTSLRNLGENAAETGFAQSGRRIFDEQNLAQDTAQTIGANRRQFANQAGNLARTFAQTYGTADLPSFNIGSTPQVSAGESKFGRSLTESPLYQLSPDVYNGLIGSEEYKRRAAVQSRASDLESAFRTTQGIDQARTLSL